MPGGDKSGPQGEGPRTGRQAGYCSGNEQPGNEQISYGRHGLGRRSFWHRHPRRHGFWPARFHSQDTDERASLLQEVKDLKEVVAGLQKKVDG